MNVYLVQATEEQLKKVNKFLDYVLKDRGLEMLADVVDIYNLVASATKLQEAPNQEDLRAAFEAQQPQNQMQGQAQEEPEALGG